MFDFRTDDKVVVLEDIIGKPNVFKKETVLFAPKDAKGIISSINESEQRAVIQFEQDQNTFRSHITISFDKIQLIRKRRTVNKKEKVKPEPKQEYKQTEKKEFPKTSGELCKMFLDDKTEKFLTVKQTEWLKKFLNKEKHTATNYKYYTNDGVNQYRINLMPNGSSRLMVVQ